MAASVVVDVSSTTTDYGVDVACLSGIGSVLGLASGFTVVANALGRRLITPRGGLFYDPEYGFDVRSYANAALTRGKMAELVAGVESECLKDERVQNVRATVTPVGFPDVTLTIALAVVLAEGPFEMVFSLSAAGEATVSIPTQPATSSSAPAVSPVATPGLYGPFLSGTVATLAGLQALSVASLQSGRTLVMVSDTNRAYWLQDGTIPVTPDDSATSANVVTSSDGVRQWIAG